MGEGIPPVAFTRKYSKFSSLFKFAWKIMSLPSGVNLQFCAATPCERVPCTGFRISPLNWDSENCGVSE